MKEFTNLYQLSKTLRFELKPEPETKARFEEWLKQINEGQAEIKSNNLFAQDKAIFEAYVALKPILDKIHEEFITISLQSKDAKRIDFSTYFGEYQKKDKNLEEIEEVLRKEIGKCYAVGYKSLNEQIVEKNKEIGKEVMTLKKEDENCLKEDTVLLYIKYFADDFVSEALPKDKLIEHIDRFKGFKGYLDGYNTNRGNYYDVTTEKATAVATRIVHENLPTFCDNILRFTKRQNDYLNAYQYLHDNNITTRIKDATKNKMVQAKQINSSVFEISHFTKCLSQPDIEKYNQTIGNNNLLINLYNQARNEEQNFTKLANFEKLYKQIGCGKKRALFLSIQKDKESELTVKERSSSDIFSVEKLLSVTAETGKRYFNNNHENLVEINTIPSFIDWLKDNKNWEGIYWSKSAVAKISSFYFDNWHDLKDKLKDNKACVSYNKKREEQIKLNDAVELSGLFNVINKEDAEFVFKKSILDNEDYKKVFDKTLPPSRNLLNLICNDVIRNITYFLDNTNDILSLEKYKENRQEEGVEDEIIKKIKQWFDAANDAIRIVKYFAVRRSKMKGQTANSTVEQALQNILYSGDVDWSKWYDAIRNYLSKKPQDDVKDNMLKLNFGSSHLLTGWSDGQEKVKRATLLKKDRVVYLCILKATSIFDTSKKYNPIYNVNGTGSRLILKTLGFKTLAGKGFKGKYNEKYSDMGKRDSLKAVECLQEIINNQYLGKYPQLEKCVGIKYTDKKQFDAEVKNILKDCYECLFKPIDWELVTEHEKNGDLFLFKIHCKDYNDKNTGKKDLQTLYWEDALKENSLHQLCAGAEIFMRKPINSIPFRHKKNEKLVNKKDADGNLIPGCIYHEIYLFSNGKKRKDSLSYKARWYIDDKKAVIKDVTHEIIKDKRFYEDTKYFFHCPIKLNYNSSAYDNPQFAYPRVNEIINNKLQENKDLHYIGIDRGEKHLIYVCIIDKEGNIIKCTDYDVINGTNYVQKLEDKADSRKIARQNWQTIGNISNLKEGYISHIVHRIMTEILNHPSYIILEDLNTEMKRGRQKIEKQIYQKFETALASKLNFVVNKEAKPGEVASIENPLQLTPPIANYQDIEGKKQFGIMLYTRANYTSVTDPATGWRKTIYLSNGNEDEIKKQVLERFSNIVFDGKDYYFEYKESNLGKVWRLYSGKDGKSLPRFRNKKEKKEDYDIWTQEAIDIVSILNNLFKNIDKTHSLSEQLKDGKLLAKVEGREETAWQSLRFVIDAIQQIRNTGINTDDDNFLYSPVRNEQGEHFDSRTNKGNNHLIQDGDANGAYNIARKGIIMDSHIKYWMEHGKPKIKINTKEINDLNLFISDKEWDLWLLNRKEWKKNLPSFAKISVNDRSTE